MLDKRGIGSKERKRFLEPDFAEDLFNPNLLKGVPKAVDRLVTALENQDTIGIFGDYDADGVPGAALLYRALTYLGCKPKVYIPTRTDGYGLNSALVQRFIEDRVALLITVDNGTVADSEIADLVKAGLQVIVCDHHEPETGKLAKQALAIINPKQSDCPYPFKELCGCAIAWKLMWALFERLGKDQGYLKWQLDLVGLATVADMVPLLGENRVLAVYGLKVLRKTRNIGLKALARVSGTDLEQLTAGSIAYRLAPRINAPSRMHQDMQEGQNAALKLLISDDNKEAFKLATYLNKQNQERQDLLEQHLKEAEAALRGQNDALCLIVYQPNWSTGVIGLLAGRLMERYLRPVIALAKEGNLLKGSVRSVDGIHAVEMVASANFGNGQMVGRYGGHSKAAGFTLVEGLDGFEAIDRFSERVQAWLGQKSLDLTFINQAAKTGADLQLNLREIDLDLAKTLKQLEPFGVGFRNPRFKTVCQIRDIRRVGAGGKHLACFLEGAGVRRKAVGFGLGDKSIIEGESYEVDYQVESEEWQGVKSVVCQIQSFVSV